MGEAVGYGRWSEAVEAAATLSADRAVAICDDRGRLYLYEVQAHDWLFGSRPLRMGARHETGYVFHDDVVRGLVQGTRVATRGDCLDRWIPVPPHER
mgnify:CR=1 FL=1